MADLPPRYAPGAGALNRDPWGEPQRPELPPQELDTRRWMLVIGVAAAAVLIVALVTVFVFGGNERGSFNGGSTVTAPSDAAAPASGASGASAAGANGAAAASAPQTSGAPVDAGRLAEARASITALELQLKAAQERGDEQERRAVALEQVLGITTRQAEGAEASLASLRAEYTHLEGDLNAMNADLTQANAERAQAIAGRAALRSQLAAAQGQAEENEARAGALSGTVSALEACLDVHEQALYYSSLDNWGLVARAMQDLAASCAAELG